MKIRGQWYCSEITMKTMELFAKIGIDYTSEASKLNKERKDKQAHDQLE